MVELEANGKSLVVYGQNGAGKSSFIDGIEYATHSGKVTHLSHEYSGAKHVLSIRNTHAPKATSSSVRFKLNDGTSYEVTIKPDGSWSGSGDAAPHVTDWDYQRTVLRQDEVAQFIHGTKGAKYSALLPLIGLGELETTATNLKHLAKSVNTEAAVADLKAGLDQLKTKNAKVFGAATAEEILAKLHRLFAKYCADNEAETDEEQTTQLLAAIDKRMSALTIEQVIHARLLQVAGVDMGALVQALRSATSKLVNSGELFLVEKLDVLGAASRFVKQVTDLDVVSCPACGKDIVVEDFKEHITEEQSRLDALQKDYEALKNQRVLLCDALALVKGNIALKELQLWREEQSKGGLTDSLAFIGDLVIQSLREQCTEEDLLAIEAHITPLIAAAKKSSETAPTSVKELVDAKTEVELISELLASRTWRNTLKAAKDLLAMLAIVEQEVRDEIRRRTEAVIKQITNDVKELWKLLHPSSAIEDVHLYMPEDTDKAIDIGLKFHGVEQASPRLTLSEGYRNGLGLCIFLAMAMADNAKDDPLFLDDVVVSFDREHRGMIADILASKFSERQVIVLTHDRDWYSELKLQLTSGKWQFKMLLPFVSPVAGISWSHSTSDFSDARAHLPHRPDSAANDARKIMDVSCAVIAEKLELMMPYRRGDRNDVRQAHQFLEQILSEGKTKLKRSNGGQHVADSVGLACLKTVDELLLSWGNRGSHTTDIVNAEAERLLTACETALKVFDCVDCQKKVWYAQSGSARQCQCGHLRWTT